MRKAGTITAVFLVFALAAFLLVACGGGGGGSKGTAKLGITADSDGGTVTIFNANTFDVVGTVAVSGDTPWGVTLSVDGKTAYVMNRKSDDISIISMSQAAEIGTIGSVGPSPRKGIIGPDGYLYVVFENDPLLAKVLVSGGTPAVVDTLTLSGTNGYAGLAVSLDGNYLYLGEFYGTTLDKVELATFTVAQSFDSQTYSLPGYIYDMDIDADGIIYMGDYDTYEILTWDTTTDTEGPVVPLGVSEVANGIVEENGKLYISNGLSYNTGYNGGALTIVDTGLDWDDFDYDSDDDNAYAIDLPFDFPFMGSSYGTVFAVSNGRADLDTTQATPGLTDSGYENDVSVINGFGAIMEDLDSAYGYFNYSSRVMSDRAVLQWNTSTYAPSDGGYATSTVSIFEIVLFDDGRARYDYLFSMPGAAVEYDSYVYGVGDGSSTLVDLDAGNGNPFLLERKSFLWNPAVSTSAMTEVPFQWEGSGALHLPIEYNPRAIAVTDDYIFLACPHPGYQIKDDDNTVTSNVVVVYDRNTMLPAGKITVGDGPRGIAVQR